MSAIFREKGRKTAEMRSFFLAFYKEIKYNNGIYKI